MSALEIIKPSWSVSTRVHAAFTLRTGGVSAPPFGSLNLGAHVGDAPEAVAENRRRVRDQLRLPAEPSWLQQVHGNAVADLDQVAAASPADAALTRRLDRVCAIQVADCIPVLFAASDGSAVAAAHAGWRGLAGGILDATVRMLSEVARVEPGRLCAWMGPGIGQDHFEVGEDVRLAFPTDAATDAAFVRNPRGRWQCNLYALARSRLLRLGVNEVAGGDDCTFSDAGRFFSFRRDGRCGRMAALVWLG